MRSHRRRALMRRLQVLVKVLCLCSPVTFSVPEPTRRESLELLQYVDLVQTSVFWLFFHRGCTTPSGPPRGIGPHTVFDQDHCVYVVLI
jgi:hypothetical protein